MRTNIFLLSKVVFKMLLRNGTAYCYKFQMMSSHRAAQRPTVSTGPRAGQTLTAHWAVSATTSVTPTANPLTLCVGQMVRRLARAASWSTTLVDWRWILLWSTRGHAEVSVFFFNFLLQFFFLFILSRTTIYFWIREKMFFLFIFTTSSL